LVSVSQTGHDTDGDGFSDADEAAAGSDPNNANSTPGTTSIVLKKGYNQVNFPAESMGYGNLFALLEALGGDSIIERALYFNEASQSYSEITYNPDGEPVGDNLALPAGGNGLNLVLYAKADQTVTFTSVFCPSWNLKAGVNLIGSPCLPEATTAFDLLAAIADHAGYPDAVISIQRFNRQTGAFETASAGTTGPVGVDFAVESGEALIITMRQEVTDFWP